MRDLSLMQTELKVLRSEHRKLSKQIYEYRKKGKTFTGTNIIERSKFLRIRIRNLHVNINQEMLKK